MIKKISKIIIYIFLLVIWYYLFDKISLNLIDITYLMDYSNLIRIILFFISVMVFFRKSKISIYSYVLAFIFSILLIVGNSIKYHQTISYLFIDDSFLIWKIIIVVEYYLLFISIFKFSKGLLSFIFEDNQKPNKYINKIFDFYKKHPLIISFILIFCAWIIYLIAYYPGIIYSDSRYQLLQYLNIPTKYLQFAHLRNPNILMTAHHPVLHTYLIGWCFSLGRYLLNDNFGFFIYSLLQMIGLIIVLSYTIKIAFKYNVKPILVILLLLTYMFTPMFAFYSITMGKDTIYYIFFALIVLFIFDYVSNYKTYELTKKNIIILFFLCLLLCLFRHNGIFILIFFIPLIICSQKKNRISLIIVFGSLLVSILTINHILIPSLGISDGSIREALSIPFQQTARFNVFNSGNVSNEEKIIINQVVDYQMMIDNYSPKLSDNVKKHYNIDASFKDLMHYFYVWAYQGISDPVMYIDATLNNTYGFYYPLISKWYVYNKPLNLSVYDIDFHYNKLESLRNKLYKYSDYMHENPILGLTSNVGFSFWWILLLTSYILHKKQYKYLITLIPLFVTFIVCVCGPANIHFRYALPNIFILPVLTLLIIFKIKNSNKKTINL